ncbi:MAG: hypothetical protein HFK09_07935 [Clostridia bacterium]|nr:hypothetical protein [Clostridia bacterium]
MKITENGTAPFFGKAREKESLLRKCGIALFTSAPFFEKAPQKDEGQDTLDCVPPFRIPPRNYLGLRPKNPFLGLEIH